MPLQRTLSTGSNDPLREYDRVIIGIDPGTNIMGYGILGIKGKQPLMIAMGLIELSKFDNHYMRLHRIYERVLGLIELPICLPCSFSINITCLLPTIFAILPSIVPVNVANAVIHSDVSLA